MVRFIFLFFVTVSFGVVFSISDTQAQNVFLGSEKSSSSSSGNKSIYVPPSSNKSSSRRGRSSSNSDDQPKTLYNKRDDTDGRRFNYGQGEEQQPSNREIDQAARDAGYEEQLRDAKRRAQIINTQIKKDIAQADAERKAEREAQNKEWAEQKAREARAAGASGSSGAQAQNSGGGSSTQSGGQRPTRQVYRGGSSRSQGSGRVFNAR